MERIGQYEVNVSPAECLGEGSFGSVFPAKHIENGTIVAAKCIKPKPGFLNWHQILQEVKTLKEASNPGHRNILSLYDHIEVKGSKRNVLWIMTKMCSLGTLNEYALKFNLSDEHKVHIMQQVSSALAYLHNHKPHPIIHRDVKPDNVLFEVSGHLHVPLLADFGVSKVMQTVFNQRLSTIAGTRPYMAPQFFKNSEHVVYDDSIDVFSAGIMFYQMVLAKLGMGMKVNEILEDMIGQKMWKNNIHCPISIKKEDSDLVKEMKAIIMNMVQLVPRRRKPMKDTEAAFNNLLLSLPNEPCLPPMNPRYQEVEDAGRIESCEDEETKEAMLRKSEQLSPVEVSGHIDHQTDPNASKESTIRATTPPPTTSTKEDDNEQTVKEARRRKSDQEASWTLSTDRAEQVSASLKYHHYDTRLPVFRKIGSHRLSTTMWFRGFCSAGALLYDDDEKTLIRLNLHKTSWQRIKRKVRAKEEESFYETKWKKSKPSELADDMFHILEDGRISVWDKKHNITIVFREDLQVLKSFPGAFGDICEGIHDILLHCKEIEEGQYQLYLYRIKDHSTVSTLSMSVTSSDISACTNDETGRFVIADGKACTMDIYTSTFEHFVRKKLSYKILAENAVASVKDFIILGETDSNNIHIHNMQHGWTQLKVDGDEILHVRSGHQGLLQVHVYDALNTDYLHVYTLD